IDEVKKQGKPYGLYFDDIQGGFTVTTRQLPQAFQVLPVMVYKVYADGRPDELVRGVDIVGTPLAALTRILTTGDQEHVFNGVSVSNGCARQGRGAAMSAVHGTLAFALALSVAPCAPLLHAASSDSKPAPDPAMVAAHASARGDALLEALLAELDRSKAQLKMDQVQPPYFIEYRLNDVEDYNAEAAYGALRENQHGHFRVLRVVVRIGDYKQDSFYARGQGESTILPLDNDAMALRHQIWLATDDAYKAAGQALAEKQAELKRFTTDTNPVDDFAKAAPLIAVEPTVSLKLDETSWKKTLEEITNLYRQYPDVQSVSASAHFSAVNEYLVNTEGTLTRCGKTTYSVQLNGSAQAADGMRLSRSPAYVVARMEELPSHDALMTDAKNMLDTIVAS